MGKKCAQKKGDTHKRETETRASWGPEEGGRRLSVAFLLIAMDKLPEEGTFQTVLKDMISTQELGRGG